MFQPSAQFCLASASPRRRALLSELGYAFDVQSADIDETPQSLDPEVVVVQLARQKAQVVAAARDSATPVLAADTIVALDGEILGKPVDADDARRMLRAMSGRWHAVLSGVALIADGRVRDAVTVTRVEMAEWSSAQIDAYVASGDPMDKAGAYAIQGVAGAWVTRIQGSYTGVVGLPLVETRALLAAANIHVTPR